MTYERLQAEAQLYNIKLIEMPMPKRTKGLYADNVIAINQLLPNTIEKACVLAEELGHYHTSCGNILDQSSLNNRKQELRARQWAYHCMLPLDSIVQAHHDRISGRYELAEYLGVTEEFLQAAIDRFTEKFGLSIKVNDQYIILFEPLGVIELF